MSEAGQQVTEEPQSERGAPGSRDTGSSEPAGGPVDRPAGSGDTGDTSIGSDGPVDGDSPDLPTGDGG